jgi:hypothetical protein
MPKKGITRNELSQLLLVYMSIASDVIDLLSILQENAIMQNTTMVYSTLICYSWSLYQFTLNLVASSSGRSVEPSLLVESQLSLPFDDTDDNQRYLILKNEIFNIIINLIMQVHVLHESHRLFLSSQVNFCLFLTSKRTCRSSHFVLYASLSSTCLRIPHYFSRSRMAFCLYYSKFHQYFPAM